MAYGNIKADGLITSTGTTVDLTSIATDNATTSEAGYMSAADKTKLDGIEASATADQTGAEIKAAYEGESDTNAFTDAEQTKLAGVEAGATADQTGAEIKTAYEAEADTNAFTDAYKAQLDDLESLSVSYPSGNTIDAVNEGGTLDEDFTNGGSGYSINVIDFGGGEYLVVVTNGGSDIDNVVPNSNNAALNGSQIVTLTWSGGSVTFTPYSTRLTGAGGASYGFDILNGGGDPSSADDQTGVSVNISSPPTTYVFNNGSDAQDALVNSPPASGKIDVGGVVYTVSDFTDETLADGKLTVQHSGSTTIAAGDAWREVPSDEPTEGLLSLADANKIATIPAAGPFFETGTWVPRMVHPTWNGSAYTFPDFYSHTMGAASGRYQRVGEWVTVWFNLRQPSSISYDNGSATAHDYVGDLPYPVDTSYSVGAPLVIYNNFSSTLSGVPAVRIQAESLRVVTLVAGDDGTNFAQSQDCFGDSQAEFTGSITYKCVADGALFSTATAD